MESTISRFWGRGQRVLQIISLTTLEDLISQMHVLQVTSHRLIYFVSHFCSRIVEKSRVFLLTLYLLLIGGRGGIKMASASTPIVVSQRASF